MGSDWQVQTKSSFIDIIFLLIPESIFMSGAANKKNMAGGPSTYSSSNTYNEQDRRKILESLTGDELATFQEAFTVFDKNQDGTITTKVRECFLLSYSQLLRFNA